MLLAYAFREAPVKLLDFTVVPELPPVLALVLKCSKYERVAWNVPFELAVLDEKYGLNLDLRHWLDPE